MALCLTSSLRTCPEGMSDPRSSHARRPPWLTYRTYSRATNFCHARVALPESHARYRTRTAPKTAKVQRQMPLHRQAGLSQRSRRGGPGSASWRLG